jgi:hypothetical protein
MKSTQVFGELRYRLQAAINVKFVFTLLLVLSSVTAMAQAPEASTENPATDEEKPKRGSGEKSTKKTKRIGPDAVIMSSKSKKIPAHLIDVDRQPIRIVYTGASFREVSESKVPKEQSEQFNRACASLGNALQVGFGPWGMGAFSEHSCHRKRVIEPDATTKLDWVLEIRPGENKEMVFRLLRLRPVKAGEAPAKPTVYNEIRVPRHPKFLEVMANGEMADFVAHAMLNSMPISLFLPSYSLVEHASVDYNRQIYRGRAWRTDARFIQPSPFDNMKLYRVFFNPSKNLYQARPAGEMTFNGFESQKIEDGKGTVTLVPVWSINDEGIRQLKAATHLWGRRAKSSKRGQERLNRLVVRIYRFLTEGDKSLVKGLLTRPDDEQTDEQGLLDKVKNLDVELPGGYAGFRYGRSLVKKDPLLSQTTFVGLLVSVKTGWLDGFSLYADISPRVRYTDELENQQYVTWQRIVLGYSFDFRIYDFRFDLTPKIGQWNFKCSLVPNKDPEAGTFSLGLTDTLAAGYELGVELRVPLVSARAWVGQDGAIAIANRFTGSSVRSLRGGIDAFYTVGELFSIGARELGVALLGFTFFDWISIENSRPTVDEEGEPIGLKSIGYVSAFIGGGLSISW